MSTVRELRGDEVAARDGTIGSVSDVYFDDERWAVHCFVVEDASRQLLIPPESLDPGLSSGGKLRLALTRGQLDGVQVGEAPGRLRSGADVIGYGIQARDGPIGRLRDIVIDDDTWEIRDIVVDTLPWWPGGLVRVHPEHIERIDWRSHKVHVRLTRGEVKRSNESRDVQAEPARRRSRREDGLL